MFDVQAHLQAHSSNRKYNQSEKIPSIKSYILEKKGFIILTQEQRRRDITRKSCQEESRNKLRTIRKMEGKNET